MKVVCALIDCATREDLLAGDSVGFDVAPCLECNCIHIYLGNDQNTAKYRLDLDYRAISLLVVEMTDKLVELRSMIQRGYDPGGVNDNIH